MTGPMTAPPATDPVVVRLRHLAANVSYREWRFVVREGDPPSVRVAFEDWFGRPFLITAEMTDSEIVQTLFLAVMVAEEHEIREAFRYRGRRVFSPHFNVEHLAGLDDEGGARA